jgi:hypothetical protein
MKFNATEAEIVVMDKDVAVAVVVVDVVNSEVMDEAEVAVAVNEAVQEADVVLTSPNPPNSVSHSASVCSPSFLSHL